MKIRWREHERIFVTITGILVLVRFLLPVIAGPVQQYEYSTPFMDRHFPFSLMRNVLLPDIGLGLLIYLSYLWINLGILPAWLSAKKKAMGTARIRLGRKGILLEGMAGEWVKRSFIALVQFILIFILLTAAYWAHDYYRNEYLFRYPGFTVFPHRGSYPNPQIDMHGCLHDIAMCLILYLVWVFIRELLIGSIERAGDRRDFRIMIANQVTGFLFLYASGLVLAETWLMPGIHGIWIVGYGLLFPCVCSVFLNLYWIFPLKGDRSFLHSAILSRLLLSSFAFALPAFVFFDFFRFFLLFGFFQLLVVTPLSWLLYQRRRERILQLRGLEKALIRSKADLQFLRSQINPHFLFNALNTLYATALLEGSERAAAGIQKLGDMMRFMLHENNRDFILMDREIEYLENYIALQKLRIPATSAISIETHIDKDLSPRRIAPMLFIPFVENAFKHGISLNERSWIKIRFAGDERYIRFEVRNSIHAREANDPEKESSGIGLKNVLARLKLLYPGRFEFSAREEGNEFVVQLAVQP